MFGVSGTFLIHFAATFLVIGIAVGLVVGKVIDLCRRVKKVENKPNGNWST
jgi:hypothetical protein